MTPILASDTTAAFVWLLVFVFRIATIGSAIPAITSIVIYSIERNRVRFRGLGLLLAGGTTVVGVVGTAYLLLVPTEPVRIELSLMLAPLATGFTAFVVWIRARGVQPNPDEKTIQP